MPIKFGYLDFQGRGQVCRLLLAYTKLQHQDIQYSIQNIQQWFTKDKHKLQLDFPSLPYLIDNKFKITQSKAIQRYIIFKAKREDLLGKNSKQRAQIQNVEGVIRDVLNALIDLFLDKNFVQNRKPTYEKIQNKLFYLESYAGGKEFFFKRITYVDFLLNVTFKYLKLFYPYEYNKFNNLERIVIKLDQTLLLKNYYGKQNSVQKLIPNISAEQPHFKNIGPLYEQHKYYPKPQEINNIEQENIEQTQQVKIQTKEQINNQIKQQLTQLTSKNHENQEKILQKQITSVEILSVNPVIHQQNFTGSQNLVQLAYGKQIQNPNVQQKVQESKAQLKIQQKASSISNQSLIKSLPQKNTQPKIQNKNDFKNRVKDYMKAAETVQTVNITNNKINQVISAHNTTVSSNSWIKKDLAKKETPTKQKQKQIKNIKQIILGYWGIRGLGQIQRLLLTYCGLQFKQKVYSKQQQWFNGDKNKLGLSFPNLPYLIDQQQELYLTQSMAINRYIIKTSKNNQLLGKNLKDQAYVENFVKILSQIFKQIRELCFTLDDEGKKALQLLNKILPNFERMNSFIGNKQFSLGYLTLVDFYIAEISFYIEKMYLEIFNKLIFFARIRKAVENNQKISKYYTLPNSIKGPFMPPNAIISI